MGLFSSLFGSSGSDKADKYRAQAIDAFNSIKTPQLSDLQVQLDKEVSAGTLTPQQAEAQLLGSNAFNDIKTDPSLTGAAKQALAQLQQIGTQGGMTAIDKAQLQDITNQTNQLAKSRNAAVIQNAQERGIGGSGLEMANNLMNEQDAADRASAAGTTVAANAQQRALDAIKSAGGLGQSLESQAYGEQANKAQAQNAIDLFNTQTANATNLYNTGTANQAQAENLANAQNISNTNTGISNANKTYNAGQNQTVFNDALAKAQGIAGSANAAATAAEKQKEEENAADMSLLGNGLKAVGTGAGFMMGGPAGATAANGVMSIGGGNTTNKNYTEDMLPYAEGGFVHPEANKGETQDQAEPENKYSHECYSEYCLHPEHEMDIQAPTNKNKTLSHAEAEPENKSLEDAYNDFVKKYVYGGMVKMADGGMVNIKPSNKEPLHMTEPHGEGYAKGGKVFGDLKKGALHRQLNVPSDKPIPSGKLDKALHSDNETLRKRAQFAENAKHFKHSEGGMIGYDEGGIVDPNNSQLSDKQKADLAAAQATPTPTQNPMPTSSHPDDQSDKTFLEKLGSLLGSHADIANDIDKNEGGMIHDFRNGGKVPGVPKVMGDSPKNDIVPAKLSPGEIVLPRSVVQNPVKVPNFVNKTLSREDPTSIALRKLRNAHLNQGA